jgi:hypothetical protein
MDHLVLRTGKRGVLIADVSASADGHGIGYGIMLKRLDKALSYAQASGLSLFFVRESPINRIVFRLESDDVRIVPRRGLRRLLAHRDLASRRSLPHRGAVALAPVDRRAASWWGSSMPASSAPSGFPHRFARCRRRPRPLYAALKRASAEYARRSDPRLESQGARRRNIGRRRDTSAAAAVVAAPAPAVVARERGAGVGSACWHRAVGAPGHRARARVWLSRDSGLRQREWDDLRNAPHRDVPQGVCGAGGPRLHGGAARRPDHEPASRCPAWWTWPPHRPAPKRWKHGACCAATS